MLEAFEPLLKRAMGLDVASIGASAIRRAVHERAAACKLADIPSYWEHVRSSETELQELIEAVVVPETWFFRDRGAFAALVRLCREEWPRTRPDGPIRLLSLPCSTGEEPYSIVMALADAGFPLRRLHVDAVDISRRALAYAQRAVYTKNSFRGDDLDYRQRHFAPKGHGFHVMDAVRQPVRFLQGNMLDEGFLPGAETYDAIFCRNLLIYFDRPTQERAVAVLARLLAARGLLFVGPSETALLLSQGFESTGMPMSFALQKASVGAREPTPAVATPSVRARAVSPIAARPRRQERVASRPLSAIKAQPASIAEDLLREAETLANQGRLAEAIEHCQRHLKQHGPSAQAFYLLGLANDAAGREREAHQQYRKALYLDPSHQETLVHLAIHLEKHGDNRGAQLLYARAKRKQTGITK